VESPHGQATVAILIFQDIVVVPMMIVIPFLAGVSSEAQGSLLLVLAKGIGLIILVLLCAKWVMPWVFYHIGKTRSRELFLLSTLAVCFTVAFLSYHLGLSLALGAFMAGLIVVVISDPWASRRITAIARKENPRIFILVRTHFLAEMERLYSLGADEVIPEEFETSIEIFSRVMAKYLIPRNEIEDFIAVTRADGYDMFRSLSKESTSFADLKFHLPDLDISTVRVNEGSTMVGKSIAEIELRKNHGVTILAIRRGHQLLSNPDADTVLKANDLLILVGTPAKLSNLCDLVTCPANSSPAF